MEEFAIWASLFVTEEHFCCAVNGDPGWVSDLVQSLNDLALVSLYFIIDTVLV